MTNLSQPDLSTVRPLATTSEWLLLLTQGLESLRRKHELTQQELAAKSGLNVDTIGRIERGLVRTRLQHATLSALAAAFGCATLAQLWEQLQHSHTSGVVRGLAELRMDARARRVFLAFQELSPTQQDTAEAVILWLLAHVRAQRSGEELLCNLDGLPGTARRR